MCNRCPGDYVMVEEKTSSMSSSYTSTHQSSSRPKTIMKRVMRPCLCHCNVSIQHIEEQGNREYCPTCHHYLRK